MRVSSLLLAAAILAALVACGTANDAPRVEAVQPTFSSLRANVFGTGTCTTCHAPGGFAGFPNDVAGGLDFSAPAAAVYASLVNAPAQGPGAATAATRVVPRDPDHSLLFLKVTSTAVNQPGFGGGMPLGAGGSLPQATKDAIRAWIAAGAPND